MKKDKKKSIYLSIGYAHIHKARGIWEDYSSNIFKEYVLNMYNPKENYSLDKLLSSDIIVIFIPEDGIIGKGVYSEYINAIECDKIYYFFSEESNQIFTRINITLLNNNDRDYNKYAKVTIIKDSLNPFYKDKKDNKVHINLVKLYCYEK